MPLSHVERVLALAVRSRIFGFAVLEGPDQLLDWGAKAFRGGVNAVRVPATEKVAELLDEYQPELVLIKITEVARLKPLMREIITSTKLGGHVSVRLVDPQEVRQFFARFDHARNKYDIATIVARRFPEMAWKLPPKSGGARLFRTPPKDGIEGYA
jgi:hypothetical protein